MKLLYLYLKDYDIFKNAEFNFDSEIQFKYCEGVLKKKEAPDIVPLPPDFFKTKDSKQCVVDSISAIIGENGSGKTTLARAIKEFYIGNSVGMEFIAALKTNGSKVKIFYHIGFDDSAERTHHKLELDNQLNDICERSITYYKEKENQSVTFADFAELVYYSPTYVPFRSFYPDPPSIHDLSQTEVLQNAHRKFLNKSPGDKGEVLQTTAFEFSEAKDILASIHEFRLDGFDMSTKQIPRPRGCLIAVNNAIAELNHNHFSALSNELNGTGKEVAANRKILEEEGRNWKYEAKLRKKISEVVALNYSLDPFVRIFITFIGCYLRDLNFDYLRTGHYDDFGTMLIAFGSFLVKKYKSPFHKINEAEAMSAITKFLTRIQSRYTKPLRSPYQGMSLEHYQTYTNVVFKVFSKFKSIYDAMPPLRRLDLMLFASEDDDSGASMTDVYELLNLIPKMNLITSFAIFRASPPLSTGEIVYLTLWTRLKRYFRKREKPYSRNLQSNEKYHLVLFYDEAETSLHPVWQKNLIYTTLKFFEQYAPHAKIHLIIASHSPILLSDIPKGNVCLLEPHYTKDGKRRVCVNQTGLFNTFGANIYDLYNDPFFLGDGTNGKFANTKISELLKEVREYAIRKMRDTDNSPQKVIDDKLLTVAKIVGDGFVRRYLHEWLPQLDNTGQ